MDRTETVEKELDWIPACAGMTWECAGMTKGERDGAGECGNDVGECANESNGTVDGLSDTKYIVTCNDMP